MPVSTAQLELLRAKLALAIGDLDVNLFYDDIKATRPNALDEPWSSDMSGPHRHIVFNNKTFVLSEVENEQQAFPLCRGCPSIDVGENIKLYLNDVWQFNVFHLMGIDKVRVRDPVTGGDLVGSLYHSLITSVEECIIKKKLDKNDGKNNEYGAPIVRDFADFKKRAESPGTIARKENTARLMQTFIYQNDAYENETDDGEGTVNENEQEKEDGGEGEQGEIHYLTDAVMKG